VNTISICTRRTSIPGEADPAKAFFMIVLLLNDQLARQTEPPHVCFAIGRPKALCGRSRSAAPMLAISFKPNEPADIRRSR
jgi:hypothetical protein